jgi:hypothetical protein
MGIFSNAMAANVLRLCVSAVIEKLMPTYKLKKNEGQKPNTSTKAGITQTRC